MTDDRCSSITAQELRRTRNLFWGGEASKGRTPDDFLNAFPSVRKRIPRVRQHTSRRENVYPNTLGCQLNCEVPSVPIWMRHSPLRSLE